MTVLSVSHVAVGVRDMERALRFYRDVLGLSVTADRAQEFKSFTTGEPVSRRGVFLRWRNGPHESFVVLAYSATERGIDGVASIAARPDGVRLYLTGGPQLSDPKKLLQGTGKQVRFLRLEAASRLAHPDVKALIDAAIEQARVRLPAEGKGRLVLRSDVSKQRPRRKPTK